MNWPGPPSQLPTMPDIKIPPVGKSVSTARIFVWHKDDGDAVVAGDLLLYLETEPFITKLTAETAGVLKITVLAGIEVSIGAVVGTLTENTATAPGLASISMRNIQCFLHNSEKIVHIDAEYDFVVKFFSQYSNGDYPREIHKYIIHAQLILERNEFGIDDLLCLQKQIDKQVNSSRLFKELEEKRQKEINVKDQRKQQPRRPEEWGKQKVFLFLKHRDWEAFLGLLVLVAAFILVIFLCYYMLGVLVRRVLY
jgi:pyruvate/2-oxoglutarate dehydrogenase complex dihydrolipoamide acyltransferase (E2) component